MTLKLRLLIASIDKARELGVDWWESDPFLASWARERALEEDRDLLKGGDMNTGGDGRMDTRSGRIDTSGGMVILARNWWVLALRGLAAILFGIAALVVPHIALVVLIALFGAYALVDGIFAIVSAVRAAERHMRWWPLLVEGLAGIAVGVLTFVWPGITALVLLYFIASWAIVTGVFEILAAIRLRREITGEWLLGLTGVLSVVFGLLLIIFPGAGALTVVWLIGVYALVFGVVLVGLALRLRSWSQERIGSRGPGAALSG